MTKTIWHKPEEITRELIEEIYDNENKLIIIYKDTGISEIFKLDFPDDLTPYDDEEFESECSEWEKWCYLDDALEAIDRAAMLEKENEILRERLKQADEAGK